MNPKRPCQDGESNASDSKRSKFFDIVCHNGFHTSYHGPSPFVHGDYTIAWICALPLELAASRAMLDEEHRTLPIQSSDDNTYVLGRIDQHNIVMACLPGQYGTNNAAVVATNLKRSFPNVIVTLMVGIGGGSPSQADLHLGDVVVGTRVMQYDMGKVLADGHFQETADAKIPARRLIAAVSDLQARHKLEAGHCMPASSRRMADLLHSKLPNHPRPRHPDRLFQVAYEHPLGASSCDDCDVGKLQPRTVRPSDEPRIHYGVIASGNSVMRDARTRDKIARRFLALCFEMEAAGMMDNLHCLPIRGICDYADSHKNKEWQSYAAATAAAFARELIESLPPWVRDYGWDATPLRHMSRPEPVDEQNLSRRQRLLDSLKFQQFDARQTTIRAEDAKTCRWFLQHPKYLDWLDPTKQSETHGFLWMRGKAGAGKSTMMKFIYGKTKKNIRDMLLDKFPDLQSVLDDTDIVPSGQQDCPGLNALKELLRSAISTLGRRSLTCFIDALDECDELEVWDMVHFFEDFTTNDELQLRICFSSRPYPYIEIRHGILLTLEDELGHAEDLAQYVKSHLRITNRLLFAELQSQILDKAAGIFIWIVLVVEILNKESSRGALAIRRKLSEIPAELSELFRGILTRDQERAEWLRLSILWILCAKKPLRPAEFRHALWAGLLEEKDQVDLELPGAADDAEYDKLVTSSSKGLAEITKAQHPTVQFIHESVRDFLVKDKGLQDLWPELGFEWEGPSHERLRRCCTAYLNHWQVRAIINGAENGDDWGNASGPGNPFPDSPFLEYASQHILHHANAAALVIPQDEFLTQFFASGGIKMINLFERYESRKYGSAATPIYVLASLGLGNLIRIQKKTEPASAYVAKQKYKYPLFAALANGHKDAVAALLDLPSTIYNGVDITEGLKFRKDLNEYQGRTPLSWAAQEGRLGIAELLIQGGADPHEIDRKHQTSFDLAIMHCHKALVRLLINEGADPNCSTKDGIPALVWASCRGHESISRLLIDEGADLNTHDENFKTALIWASLNGSNDVARLLVDKGADINARCEAGMTALIWAIRNGHVAIARDLIARGADVNAHDKHGETALTYASYYGYDGKWTIPSSRQDYEDVARLLIDRGADVNAQDNEGKTALIHASIRGFRAIARLLIDRGADVNAQDNEGKTALIHASTNGHNFVMRLLEVSGADINVKK